MMIRGGDRRVLAVAAAGMYVIYVVLTCVFYFVGLAYDNVSEVTLFVLFMGAPRLDPVSMVAQRLRTGWRSRSTQRALLRPARAVDRPGA